MNLAKIHDGQNIKTFWEKRINNDCQHAENEEKRRKRSALKKLRGEWLVRLETRTKHLKKLNDSVKKVQVEQVEQVEQSADQT